MLFIWCVKSPGRPQAQALCCKKKNVGRGGSPAPWRAWGSGKPMLELYLLPQPLAIWGFGQAACKVGHPGVTWLLQPQDIHLPLLPSREPRASCHLSGTTLVPFGTPQLPAHLSACPCCTILTLLCANVLGQVEGNAAEPAQPVICLLARCPLCVSAVQFYWHRSLSGS